MARPKVITNCVADTYVDKHRERIIEFVDPAGENRPGGLISFRHQDDGSLDVYLYRLDAKVRVHVSGERGNEQRSEWEHADPRGEE